MLVGVVCKCPSTQPSRWYIWRSKWKSPSQHQVYCSALSAIWAVHQGHKSLWRRVESGSGMKSEIHPAQHHIPPSSNNKSNCNSQGSWFLLTFLVKTSTNQVIFSPCLCCHRTRLSTWLCTDHIFPDTNSPDRNRAGAFATKNLINWLNKSYDNKHGYFVYGPHSLDFSPIFRDKGESIIFKYLESPVNISPIKTFLISTCQLPSGLGDLRSLCIITDVVSGEAPAPVET